MKAGEVAALLARNAEGVAAYLLPNGNRKGREWECGSVAGEAGDSLKVCLVGEKAGRWSDFAESEKGGDLLDLWCAVRHIGLVQAIGEAKSYLGIAERRKDPPRKAYEKPSKAGVSRLLPQHAEWLRVVRKLSDATIEAFKLASRDGSIMFPYLVDGDLVFAKYRKPPGKEFRVDAGCEPCLFGWQALPDNARVVAICEGELDALALREYGIPALSVPFGGGKGEKQAKWIEAEYDRLAVMDAIFLCMDRDQTGADAVEEIISRLGRERCRIVELPKKDANECLVENVPRETIITAFSEARTRDPEQLHSASDYGEELEREFAQASEPERGIRLPWRKVNDRLVLRMGEVSIWAGFNGHGKSETIGNVTISAAVDGWECCVASMEFRPVKWLKRLVRQATGLSNPSHAYVRHVSHWFKDRIWVFDAMGTQKANDILSVFGYAARRYGVKFFVIDNLAKCGFGEDDYNGQKGFVDALTDFTRMQDVHVALVCHMRKTDAEERPGGKMDVKGTGGITDMADTLVTVWRNKVKEKKLRELARGKGEDGDAAILDAKALDDEQPDAIIQCHKQRNGEHEPTIRLWFDRSSHQYLDSPQQKVRPLVGMASVETEQSIEI
jgi:twinkle protein